MNANISRTLVAFAAVTLIVLVAVSAATTLVSANWGDVYFFPQQVLVGVKAQNAFLEQCEFKGWRLTEFGWFTAERRGSVWQFYVELRTNDDWGTEWTNGLVLYDVKSKRLKTAINTNNVVRCK